MEIRTISFFTVLAALFSLSAISSCSKSERFAGSWQDRPERLMVQDASDATATVTIDFAPTEGKAGSGNVNLSAVIEIQQPATSSAPTINQVWEANVAATASVSGRYVATDDDDDIVVSLDPSTFRVDVDPAGVTFSQNILSGLEKPQLDSLTASTADRWRILITPAVRKLFNEYGVIDDIEVHSGNTLTFEIGKIDHVLTRVGVPD